MADEQKVYVGQTALSIQLDTKIDLTSGATFLIKYVKPDATTGSWTAAVIGVATDGIIGYTADAGELDAAGDWKVWAHVTFNDATFAPGDPATFTVYTEGN